MNLADVEVVTQLMDVAAQRGLDLVALRFGGPDGISVQFSRQPQEPAPSWTVPDRAASEAVNAVFNPPSRPPPPNHTHPSLWTNGKAPTFAKPQDR